MSFTQDELQSFNTILEQKLAIQRRELEHTFDRRTHLLKREFEKRLASAQQEMARTLTQSLIEQHRKFKELLDQRLNAQHSSVPQSPTQEPVNDVEHKHQLEAMVERALAAQLIAIEELIGQRFQPSSEAPSYILETPAQLEGIELQTEIPWDEIAEVINKAFEEHLSMLDESFRSSMKNVEQYLSTRLHSLQEELAHARSRYNLHEERNERPELYNNTITNMQDLFTSIDRLERIIESMQVAMTSNHALLSNRIYHHQQLPLERAHPNSQLSSNQNTSSPKGQLSSPKEGDK